MSNENREFNKKEIDDRYGEEPRDEQKKRLWTPIFQWFSSVGASIRNFFSKKTKDEVKIAEASHSSSSSSIGSQSNLKDVSSEQEKSKTWSINIRKIVDDAYKAAAKLIKFLTRAPAKSSHRIAWGIFVGTFFILGSALIISVGPYILALSVVPAVIYGLSWTVQLLIFLGGVLMQQAAIAALFRKVFGKSWIQTAAAMISGFVLAWYPSLLVFPVFSLMHFGITNFLPALYITIASAALLTLSAVAYVINHFKGPRPENEMTEMPFKLEQDTTSPEVSNQSMPDQSDPGLALQQGPSPKQVEYPVDDGHPVIDGDPIVVEYCYRDQGRWSKVESIRTVLKISERTHAIVDDPANITIRTPKKEVGERFREKLEMQENKFIDATKNIDREYPEGSDESVVLLIKHEYYKNILQYIIPPFKHIYIGEEGIFEAARPPQNDDSDRITSSISPLIVKPSGTHHMPPSPPTIPKMNNSNPASPSSTLTSYGTVLQTQQENSKNMEIAILISNGDKKWEYIMEDVEGEFKVEKSMATQPEEKIELSKIKDMKIKSLEKNDLACINWKSCSDENMLLLVQITTKRESRVEGYDFNGKCDDIYICDLPVFSHEDYNARIESSPPTPSSSAPSPAFKFGDASQNTDVEQFTVNNNNNYTTPSFNS